MLIERSSPYSHWEFTHPGTGDQLRLVPDRGGLVSGWRCGGEELLYLDQERFLNPHLSVRGGIPVLFPICGGLPPEQSSIPQHGFARDLPWQLAALADGSGVSLELVASPTSLALYPHAFHLEMVIRPEPSALAFTVRVHNRGGTAMPFSFGLHPYFAVSSLESVYLEGLPVLVVDQQRMVPAQSAELSGGLPQGIDLLAEPLSTVQLVDSIAHRRISLVTTSPLDLVVVWSDPPRSMVCLEPWTSPRGSLLSGERLLVLEPGQSLQMVSCYRVSSI